MNHIHAAMCVAAKEIDLARYRVWDLHLGNMGLFHDGKVRMFDYPGCGQRAAGL